ncbi:MAG: phospholipid/cholesterol/gamma-HCH transport system substrate-binding protein [Actinomycetota bacterium]|jgi:phospholipid/cholesterol/gamma-HCH transport system substrate-binding protein|nr:phospholipid/cholesterol/gamma-HCH transport system substrate-binding protein [Actinomycetota bacterium]
MRFRRTTALLALAGCTALTGCQFKGAAAIPLPGGEGGGKGAYKVTIEFPDVLDLVPQSAVKVNDVTVGSVTSIEVGSTQTYSARVRVRIRKDVVLPANAHASLRQTSLLGEKFVSLDPPTTEQPEGRLRDGAMIGLDRTTRNADIEEVLAALSLVLNGGSLEQLQTINRELVLALKGRESKVRDLLTQLDTFVGGLDKQKADIVRALDGLDKLTSRLAAQRDTLAVGLRDIPAGVSVLADQRAQLTQVLTGLSRLGTVAVQVIRASQQNTVADLRSLEPILTQLNRAGKDLPDSLELLTTYPFPRTVDEGIKGDYANLFVTADINLVGAGSNTGIIPGPVASLLPSPPAVPGVPKLPLPKVPAPLPGTSVLPSLPGLADGGANSLLTLLLGGLS